MYGYLSNSRIKLIAVSDDEEVKDGEMKALFRRLHALYVDTVSNPFHTVRTGCSHTHLGCSKSAAHAADVLAPCVRRWDSRTRSCRIAHPLTVRSNALSRLVYTDELWMHTLRSI